MSKDRKLFSDSDGTKIGEDLKAIIAEKRENLDRLFRKFAPTGEKLIDFLKAIDAEIREGTPTDLMIDKILSVIKIKGDPDERLYKFIQDNIGGFISQAVDLIEAIDESENDNAEFHSNSQYCVNAYESFRNKTASVLLQKFHAISETAVSTLRNHLQ